MQIVQLLFENGVEVDGVDKYGMTALHHAAFHGNTDICRLLIENKGLFFVYIVYIYIYIWYIYII